ncbi:hypothetical protein, conserved [Eimeria maxima]|uniref:Uncharacterized protein n=1 Tax=Eimeria maxima TaxID=5804 RepID=U6MGK8_EIMMA|nr:hypothetical protein, conserved [Eimeria maxima]CDJ60785.1 hypothetical protein, conserved [Eimeria maxima]
MHSHSQHPINRQPASLYLVKQDLPSHESAGESRLRPHASRGRGKPLAAAAIVLAVLIRGWYCVMAKPTLPPAGGGRILPGSISNDTEDSIGSGEEAGQTQKLGPDTNQPTPPVVPEKKIYEMKLEPQEYERPKTADIDWMRVWMEESTSGQGSIGGYEPPETFLNSKTRQMFEKIVGLGVLRLWVHIIWRASQEPWLTEEELEMHPLGGLRKQFSPLAAEFVEDAIRDLTKSPHAFVGYNPYKEVDLDGYGKILIQRKLAADEAAEEIETALRTGRGVLVCHLPTVDIAAVLNQPDGIDEPVPILDEEFGELDLFRQKLEETMEVFVEHTVQRSDNYKVIRITQSPGVRRTTVVSLYGKAK